MPKIDIIACDDWIALYRDGIKIEEGHSISLMTGLTALGISVTEKWLSADPYTVDLSDCFPERLSDADLA